MTLTKKFLLKSFLILFYITFSFWVIRYYYTSLEFIPSGLYRDILGDGASHINFSIIFFEEMNFGKIHWAPLYGNNYYIFSYPLIFFLNLIIKNIHLSACISLLIINLLALYFYVYFIYKISLILSRSNISALFSIIICFYFPFIILTLKIYPDILQYSLFFGGVYFFLKKENYNIWISSILLSLSFGTKGQGLLIFLYIMTMFFFLNLKDDKLKLFYKCCIFFLIFIVFFIILNKYNFLEQIMNYKSRNNFDAQSFNNIELTNYYLNKFIIKNKFNLIFFIIGIVFTLFQFKSLDRNLKIKYIVSILFLFLYYLHLINMNNLVQGARYLHHMLVPIIIIFNINYLILSNVLKKKTCNILYFLLAILTLYNITYDQTEKLTKFYDLLNVKKKVNSSKILNQIKSGQFISKYLEKGKKSICAGAYSYVPNKIATEVIRTWFFYNDNNEKPLDYSKCDIIIMDSFTPGFIVWMSINDLNEKKLIYKNIDNLSPFWKRLGTDNLKFFQKFIVENIFKSKNYKLIYDNEDVFIFEKNQKLNQ